MSKEISKADIEQAVHDLTAHSSYEWFVESDQSRYRQAILKGHFFENPRYYQLNEQSGSTAEEKPEQGA